MFSSNLHMLCITFVRFVLTGSDKASIYILIFFCFYGNFMPTMCVIVISTLCRITFVTFLKQYSINKKENHSRKQSLNEETFILTIILCCFENFTTVVFYFSLVHVLANHMEVFVTEKYSNQRNRAEKETRDRKKILISVSLRKKSSGIQICINS